MPRRYERSLNRISAEEYDAIFDSGYRRGFRDGQMAEGPQSRLGGPAGVSPRGRKRKLSAWNKFVKANSNKKIYQYANGKLKLKKMGIAYRKKKR